MGRIKSTLVKRTARRLLQENKVDDKLFTDSFEHNKKVMGRSMPSKKIRNKIAGYVSRLMKVKKQRAPKPTTINEMPQYEMHPSYS